MNRVELITQHVSSFPENRLDKEPKEPKKPEPPEEPKYFSGGDHKTKQRNQDAKVKYERAVKNYPKRLKAWQKRVADWEKLHERWETEAKRKKTLQQLKHFANGELIGGSPHRALSMHRLENTKGEDYFINGSGGDYPNFKRYFPDISDKDPVTTFTDLTQFKKVVDVVTKVTNQAIVEISGQQMTFRAAYRNNKEPDFIKADWALDWPIKDPLKFGINPKYLSDMLKLFNQLKIKEVEMYVISPVRPFLFVAGDLTYLITPIRIS